MPGAEVSPFFVRAVKNALHNLYDPDVLRKSPLIGLLDLDPAQGAAPLRQALIAAIESLKPDPSVARDARPWRVYWILFYLYVSQFSRPMVATNLALSVRQVIREEMHAVEVIADYLWSRYQVAAKMETASPPGEDGDGRAAVATGPSREDELLWLEKSLPLETVTIADVIARTVETMQPLLARQGVRVQTVLADGLPDVLLPSAILYQAMLNCLTAAACAAAGGDVTIRAEAGGRGLRVSMEVVAANGAPTPLGESEGLDMARQLLHMLNGTLEVQNRPPFGLTLSLPVVEHVPVLVVDDNADALQLFQRYLAGSRYTVVATRDPLEALRLAAVKKPRAILLDVMLPGMDGWQVLQRLLHSPATQKTPIIVCSILPEEQLALAMGAARYLRKPVSQAALLAALDQETGAPGSGSSASPG